jgi:hypothetical protein
MKVSTLGDDQVSIMSIEHSCRTLRAVDAGGPSIEFLGVFVVP